MPWNSQSDPAVNNPTSYSQPSWLLLSNNLRWLGWIRLVVVLAQSTALTYAYVEMQLGLQYQWIVSTLLAQLALVGLTFVQSRSSAGLSLNSYLANVLGEIFLFTLLIYLTGGATNPFVFYYLVPLTLSVLVLPPKFAWVLTLVCLSCYTLLMFKYQHLHLFDMSHGSVPSINNPHILGMWLNFAVSAVIITGFVSYMANQIRKQEQELAVLDQQRRDDEHILAMGALAAGTAHELGTPLSTVTLILEELRNSENLDKQQQGDIETASSQLVQCRSKLKNLVRVAETLKNREQGHIAVDVFVNRITEQCRLLYPSVDVRLELDPKTQQFQLSGTASLEQGVFNLLANAAEASDSSQTGLATALVTVIAEVDKASTLAIKIVDNGAGIRPDILQQLGRTHISTKKHGMGLGYFLANSAINRAGGTLEVDNLEAGGVETIIRIPVLPLDETSSQ